MEMMHEEKKRFPIWKMILVGLATCLLLLYFGGYWFYRNRFVKGTVIDWVDVSGMTLGDLEEQTQNYMLRIVQRKADGATFEEDIQGKDISLGYASLEPLKALMQSQNHWLWFLRQESSYEMKGHLCYREELLEAKVKELRGFQEGFYTAPTDAYISEYIPGQGTALVPESQGNLLNWERAYDTIKAAVESLSELVDLDKAGCYEIPEITTEHEQLQDTLDILKKYEEIEITYTFGDQKEVLNGELIGTWLDIDGFDVILDTTQVENYVASLRKKYDSIFRPRTFMTSYDKEIEIDTGDYGWWMNYTQEGKELVQMIEAFESGERTPVYYQTAAAYGKPDYGDTYVEINLTAQHLFFYQDGELLLESDFVSGNSARGYDTPDGVYGITYKERNATLIGENYETPVSYWMPFNGNVGLHDADWRSSFGGNIYKTNGSHGCINLPPSVAEELYEYVEKGTPVICYRLPGTEPKRSKMLEKS